MYFAHTGNIPDGKDWHTLKNHLESVAELARCRAACFGAGDWGHIIGLLHDLGKYSEAFQRRLYGSTSRADHATAGAKIAMAHVLKLMGPQFAPLGKILAFVIAGHHTGLANGIDDGHERSTLKQRLATRFGEEIPNLDEIWREEIKLPQIIKYPLMKTHQPPSKYENFGLMFLTRMLFSCLIDSDRIDTENFARTIDGKLPISHNFASITDLREKLNEYLTKLFKKSEQTDVNNLRHHILTHARREALKMRCSGLYSLTVPTGGGKTLTSLAFGLDHAAKYSLRRVIYVIPFTSIIEQTADVFRKAVGHHKNSVVECHSAFDREKIPEEVKIFSKSQLGDFRDKLRLSMESWDAPVIVTTAVQFFESLFSDRTTQCRKLHNITNSVIVLDEAQTLPLKLLRPIMAAIDELALNYGCTIVLCTATQPALKNSDEFHNGFYDVQEIAPNPPELFKKLNRTQIKLLGDQSDEQLVAHLLGHPQVLMIVNNRKHARGLFNSIEHEEGSYHLTTTMCAEHRRQVLAEIRQRLNGGSTCRLVSTSLIEAGVDIDFPTVYRAEAGLDSIAQAAGRCNREGKHLPEDSKVFIFNSPEWKTPPELAQMAAPMRSVLRNHDGNVLSPEALKSYFQQVYCAKSADLDHHQVLKQIRDTEGCDFPFQNIARAFRMIDSNMLPIVIPFDDVAIKNLELLRKLPKNQSVGRIAQNLQRYVVQVPEKTFVELMKLGALKVVAPEKFVNQFYELQGKDLYSEKAGLNFADPGAISAESSVF